MQIFFKMATYNIFRWQPPRYSGTLTAYSTLNVRGYPWIFFSIKNDRKGRKKDYLDTQGHFVLRFGAIGENPLGGW